MRVVHSRNHEPIDYRLPFCPKCGFNHPPERDCISVLRSALADVEFKLSAETESHRKSRRKTANEGEFAVWIYNQQQTLRKHSLAIEELQRIVGALMARDRPP